MAITFFVVPVVVDSVQRVPVAGTISHVAEELGERLLPGVTNTDATIPVSQVFWMVFVVTPLDHIGPTSVFWRSRHPMLLFFSGHWFSSLRYGRSQYITAMKLVNDRGTGITSESSSVNEFSRPAVISETEDPEGGQ